MFLKATAAYDRSHARAHANADARDHGAVRTPLSLSSPRNHDGSIETRSGTYATDFYGQ